MDEIVDRLAGLSVAHLCDACLRLGLPLRHTTVSPVIPGQRTQGRVRPVRHHGSVDVFLEALERASAGEVLVIDNDGRSDEGCIGDLTALEVQQARLAGIVVWGRHRDTAILREIGIPVFSLGACGMGPIRLDPRVPDTFVSARAGEVVTTSEDYVVADDDGALFIAGSAIIAAVEAGEAIRDTEERQTRLMRDGTSLREQLRFGDYLRNREADPKLDFRKHLRMLGGAIEE